MSICSRLDGELFLKEINVLKVKLTVKHPVTPIALPVKSRFDSNRGAGIEACE